MRTIQAYACKYISVMQVVVIHRTAGKEPYLSSVSKYSIQQPMSNDVGEEMVKIMGENHALKHQIEEVGSL